FAAHFFYGTHITKPTALNGALQAQGYSDLSGYPSNAGLKIVGENRGRLYGVDLNNLSQKGRANEHFDHTLNSVRVYGNLGKKIYEGRSWELRSEEHTSELQSRE